MSVDAAKNAAVYGGLTPRQILDGTIDPPPEMQVPPSPCPLLCMHPVPARPPARCQLCHPESLLVDSSRSLLAAAWGRDTHTTACSSTLRRPCCRCYCCRRPRRPPLLACPQPLYSELSLIVHQATSDVASSAPGRVSASLERYSTGGWLGGWLGWLVAAGQMGELCGAQKRLAYCPVVLRWSLEAAMARGGWQWWLTLPPKVAREDATFDPLPTPPPLYLHICPPGCVQAWTLTGCWC